MLSCNGVTLCVCIIDQVTVKVLGCVSVYAYL